MIVVSDIDGTLARTLDACVAAVNAWFGVSYTPDEWTKYPLGDNLPKKQHKWLSKAKISPDFIVKMKPCPEAVEALAQIKARGHHVIISTDRDRSTRDATITWLRRQGVSYDELYMAGEGSKRDLAYRFHSQGMSAWLFDDDPRKMDFWPTVSTPLWMPKMPYTPATVAPYTHVFSDWDTPLAALFSR